jgi:hypothetical protein
MHSFGIFLILYSISFHLYPPISRIGMFGYICTYLLQSSIKGRLCLANNNLHLEPEPPSSLGNFKRLFSEVPIDWQGQVAPRVNSICL